MALKLGVYTDFPTRFQQAFPGSEFVTEDLVTTFRPSPASTASVDRLQSDQPPADPQPSGCARAEDFCYASSVAHTEEGWQPDEVEVVRLASGRVGVYNTIAVIGGTKFDATALETWVRSLPKSTVIVTGDGRGAEKALRSLCKAQGIRIDVPLLLDIAKPLEVQIEAILSMTQDSRSPVVFLGQGSRVDTARKWLKRGRWGREIETL